MLCLNNKNLITVDVMAIYRMFSASSYQCGYGGFSFQIDFGLFRSGISAKFTRQLVQYLHKYVTNLTILLI